MSPKSGFIVLRPVYLSGHLSVRGFACFLVLRGTHRAVPSVFAFRNLTKYLPSFSSGFVILNLLQGSRKPCFSYYGMTLSLLLLSL